MRNGEWLLLVLVLGLIAAAALWASRRRSVKPATPSDAKPPEVGSGARSGSADIVPRFEYMWGFVNASPTYYSGDLRQFGILAGKVFKNGCGVSIGASLHPYQALHPVDNIWQSCLDYIRQSGCVDLRALVEKSESYHMNPPRDGSFHRLADKRLLYEVNPIYSKYVPFLIPYISFNEDPITHGEACLARMAKERGDASPFLDDLSAALAFLFRPENGSLPPDQLVNHQPYPMVLGFGIYTPGEEADVISEFERFRIAMLEKT